MLSTNQKGCIAETAIIHQSTKLGVGVLKAINDGSRYDLISIWVTSSSVSSASGRAEQVT